MKLIFCPECEDVVRLQEVDRQCRCGKSGGKYTDIINAEIWGKAIPIGFNNSSFVAALLKRPDEGMGSRFEAFVIPHKCASVKKVGQ